MKLHWSPRSPFVRKVMIVVHELDLVGQITLVRSVAEMSKVNPQLSADNPLNKLPTLVLEDGSVLYDSPVICDYLDAGYLLHPVERIARIEALRRQALGDGLLDLSVLRRNELGRPVTAQSSAHLEAWAAKIDNVLGRLEGEAESFASRPFDIGHVAIGCALGYLDFRFPALDWRHGRQRLAAWAQAFEQRPSAVATRAAQD